MADCPDRPNEWYQVLVRHSADIVAVLDAGGIMRYKSPAIENHLGYEPQDMIGEDIFAYINPDDRARVELTVQPVFDGIVPRSAPVEYRFQHADGSWLWFESILTDCIDTALDGYLVNSRDITERKHQEKALRQERDQLEEFASVLSHDLRNPLNVAMGRLELAQAESDSVHLENAAEALDRMEALIQDILALAREGDEVNSLEPVGLGAIAESCWQTMTTSEATLQVEADQTIHADGTRSSNCWRIPFGTRSNTAVGM